MVVLCISVRIEKGLSEKEAVIYHGYTLTTKIAFRDVIHAINVSMHAWNGNGAEWECNIIAGMKSIYWNGS